MLTVLWIVLLLVGGFALGMGLILLLADAPFLFAPCQPFSTRCPNTGYRVPGPSQPKMRRTIPRNYQAVTCSVCERVYLVNPATGKVFGEDE